MHVLVWSIYISWYLVELYRRSTENIEIENWTVRVSIFKNCEQFDLAHPDALNDFISVLGTWSIPNPSCILLLQLKGCRHAIYCAVYYFNTGLTFAVGSPVSSSHDTEMVNWLVPVVIVFSILFLDEQSINRCSSSPVFSEMCYQMLSRKFTLRSSYVSHFYRSYLFFALEFNILQNVCEVRPSLLHLHYVVLNCVIFLTFTKRICEDFYCGLTTGAVKMSHLCCDISIYPLFENNHFFVSFSLCL